MIFDATSKNHQGVVGYFSKKIYEKSMVRRKSQVLGKKILKKKRGIEW